MGPSLTPPSSLYYMSKQTPAVRPSGPDTILHNLTIRSSGLASARPSSCCRRKLTRPRNTSASSVTALKHNGEQRCSTKDRRGETNTLTNSADEGYSYYRTCRFIAIRQGHEGTPFVPYPERHTRNLTYFKVHYNIIVSSTPSPHKCTVCPRFECSSNVRTSRCFLACYMLCLFLIS